jgi:hypothetical protein
MSINVRRAALDKAIDELSNETKFSFLSELANGSLGRADQLSGIKNMWVSARLASRLLKPVYLEEIKSLGAANGV